MAEGSDGLTIAMKNPLYTKIICGGFCPFYRAGKEDLTCGTYNFLVGIVTAAELKVAVREIKAVPDLFCDAEIKKFICRQCDFLIDGCDFRAGTGSRSCGGHTIVSGLMRKSLIPFGLGEQ